MVYLYRKWHLYENKKYKLNPPPGPLFQKKNDGKQEIFYKVPYKEKYFHSFDH
jgi:hypothetical protein